MALLIFRSLLLLIILTTSSINSGLCFPKNSRNSTQLLTCRNEDREALLKIKLSLSDLYNSLQSWELSERSDCCKWKGVGCGATSGHVIKLELLPHTTYLEDFEFQIDNAAYGKLYAYSEPSLFAYELSPHLLELKHLNHLDLSGIELVRNATSSTSNSFPNFIGSMKQLRYLNLSNVYFDSKIPHALGNLTNFEVLDLGYIPYYELVADDITWVSSLVALRYLDLSFVNLTRTRDVVLQVLGELPSLSHLALGSCGLETTSLSRGGRVFNSTPLFANLQYLDLSWNDWTVGEDFPSALRNMTALKYLDLSGNDFTRTRDDGVLQVLGVLFPSLSHLSLRSCGLDGSQMLSHGGRLFNSTLLAKLQYLDLSENGIECEIPSWLRNMTTLTYLDLSYYNFNSSVPIWFDCFKSLVDLDLSGNDFTKIEGGLSHFIRGKCNLRYLNLGFINGDSGVEIDGNHSSSSSTFANGFFCGGASSKLEFLDAWGTRLKGIHLFDWLGHLPNLRALVLTGNSLSGQFPNQILATLTGLRRLVLQDNQLNGTLDANTLGKLTNLVELDLSSNRLEGAISQLHFANLSQLKYLDISSNNNLSIDLQQPAGWVPPFQLHDIRMGSCNFQAQIPWWIQTQAEVSWLDLSNANISGDISNILGTSTKLTKLLRLDISHNQLFGAIPLDLKKKLPSLSYLLLNDNHLSGSIPTSLCYLESLGALDLSANQFSGAIPDCWTTHSSIYYIDLSSNKLSGNIPISLGNLHGLNSLHLNNNSLHGEIPYSLGTLQQLIFLDLGENNLSGILPAWIGKNLIDLRALSLRGNHLTGNLDEEICSLSALRILDLGGNDLGGHIPNCLGHMDGMAQSITEYSSRILRMDRMIMLTKGLELEYTTNLPFVVALDLSSNKFVGSVPENLTMLVGLKSLNLSHNFLSGNIPKKIGDLKKLESLDLSNNHLSGSVPSSITSLTSLSRFNLSNNNLQGRVPSSTQLDTLDDSEHSIYAGNPLLCGEKLSKKCPGDPEESVPSPREEHDEDDDVFEKLMLYISVMLGIVTGFGGVVASLVLNRTWRAAYFNFAEDVMGSVYGVFDLTRPTLTTKHNCGPSEKIITKLKLAGL